MPANSSSTVLRIGTEKSDILERLITDRIERRILCHFSEQDSRYEMETSFPRTEISSLEGHNWQSYSKSIPISIKERKCVQNEGGAPSGIMSAFDGGRLCFFSHFLTVRVQNCDQCMHFFVAGNIFGFHDYGWRGQRSKTARSNRDLHSSEAPTAPIATKDASNECKFDLTEINGFGEEK